MTAAEAGRLIQRAFRSSRAGLTCGSCYDAPPDIGNGDFLGDPAPDEEHWDDAAPSEGGKPPDDDFFDALLGDEEPPRRGAAGCVASQAAGCQRISFEGEST